MGLFNFVPNWRDDLLGRTLDIKMSDALRIGKEAALAKVHVQSGWLKSTISGGYEQSTKTLMLWADAKYAWVEEMRGPDHAYLAAGLKAMAGFWGGSYNYEAHFMHSAPMRADTPLHQIEAKEKAWRKKSLGWLVSRKTKVRLHHRRDSGHRRMLDPFCPALAEVTFPIL